jgi:hypothetical protein
MDTTKQHKLFKDNILQLDNEISKLRNQIYSNTYEQPSITPPPDSPYHPHSSYKTSHQQLNNTPNASSHPEAPTPTPTYTYYGLSPSLEGVVPHHNFLSTTSSYLSTPSNRRTFSPNPQPRNPPPPSYYTPHIHQQFMNSSFKLKHKNNKYNNNFGYSKFNIEIRCLNSGSNKKYGEDFIKKIAFLEDLVCQKENTMNNLLNNVVQLENQLNVYRNENEALKNKELLQRTKDAQKIKELEDVIKNLEEDNKTLEEENKNLKVDNVTLYQMCQEKQGKNVNEGDNTSQIQRIFIKENFLNNKDETPIHVDEEDQEQDNNNMNVMNRNYSSTSQNYNNNNNMNYTGIIPLSRNNVNQQQQQYQYQQQHQPQQQHYSMKYHANTEYNNKNKDDISNMESYRDNEAETPLTSSRNGRTIDNNNNYNSQITEINKHIATLNNEISSHNEEITKSKNEINKLESMKTKLEHQQQQHYNHHQQQQYHPYPQQQQQTISPPHKSTSTPFHIEISKSTNPSQVNLLSIHHPIFTLYDNKRILCFDPDTKTFSLIEFTDLSKQFNTSYKKNGSLYLSLNNSLYIITGNYFDTLYQFNIKDRTMKKLSNLNHNHCYGGLISLTTSYSTELICISGTSNKHVELYATNPNNSNNSNIPQLDSNLWYVNSNELTTERSQSMYVVHNNKYIFAFFGFCYPQNRYLNSIEYCEIIPHHNERLSQWRCINVIANVENIPLYLKGHFVFSIGSSQENEEGLIVLGGYDGLNNCAVVNYIEIGFEEGEDDIMVNIRPINKNIVDVNVNEGYVFNQGVPALAMDNMNKNIVLFDQKFNVHVLNREELSHDIYYFE